MKEKTLYLCSLCVRKKFCVKEKTLRETRKNSLEKGILDDSCNNLDDSVSREGQEMVILHRANLKRKKRNEKKDICCTVDSGTGGRLFVGERRAGSQANTIANYPAGN